MFGEFERESASRKHPHEAHKASSGAVRTSTKDNARDNEERRQDYSPLASLDVAKPANRNLTQDGADGKRVRELCRPVRVVDLFTIQLACGPSVSSCNLTFLFARTKHNLCK
jgi:hypothetical protein